MAARGDRPIRRVSNRRSARNGKLARLAARQNLICRLASSAGCCSCRNTARRKPSLPSRRSPDFRARSSIAPSPRAARATIFRAKLNKPLWLSRRTLPGRALTNAGARRGARRDHLPDASERDEHHCVAASAHPVATRRGHERRCVSMGLSSRRSNSPFIMRVPTFAKGSSALARSSTNRAISSLSRFARRIKLTICGLLSSACAQGNSSIAGLNEPLARSSSTMQSCRSSPSRRSRSVGACLISIPLGRETRFASALPRSLSGARSRARRRNRA